MAFGLGRLKKNTKDKTKRLQPHGRTSGTWVHAVWKFGESGAAIYNNHVIWAGGVVWPQMSFLTPTLNNSKCPA